MWDPGEERLSMTESRPCTTSNHWNGKQEQAFPAVQYDNSISECSEELLLQTLFTFHIFEETFHCFAQPLEAIPGAMSS